MERSVRVNGEDTSVRSIKLKDVTGSCKVSLWRDLTKKKTSVGSHITLTNVVVQVYNDEKSVSTTTRTKIEVKTLH
jgi:ssDNA-binding replication factor A large subunit